MGKAQNAVIGWACLRAASANATTHVLLCGFTLFLPRFIAFLFPGETVALLGNHQIAGSAPVGRASDFRAHSAVWKIFLLRDYLSVTSLSPVFWGQRRKEGGKMHRGGTH